MKKYVPYILPFLALTVSLILFLSSQSSEKSSQSAPQVLAMVKSVEIPDEIEFAGEKMDVTRYDLHERFDREMNVFCYMHASTMLLFKRANRYFPIIEPILKANDIPEDFKYLAAIESNLSPRAMSPAKAVGIWQLMPETASERSLEITDEVDERYSIEKSTEAACKYFRNAYRKYGSWVNVAVSYNAGMGRVSSELSNQQSRSVVDLWLNEESSRYFFRIAAAKLIFESPLKYGFVITPETLYKQIEFKDVTVASTVDDLAQFAKEQGISYADLKEFNSWLRDRKLTVKPGKSYTLKIPAPESLTYKDHKIKVYDEKWLANREDQK
ncbi:MAG: lytic transglycosylase [Bacteroidales bacterium 45-6]|nr:MAG: lytic transglycosylase [Bacteroidales bacterium 45-6]